MCSINIDICGKRGAGKSSLLSRFIAGTFNEGVRETNGVHMGIKKILLDNITINLYLWDSKMYNKTENYEARNFRNVDGFLFVFDCTDKDAMGEYVYLFVFYLLNLHRLVQFLLATRFQLPNEYLILFRSILAIVYRAKIELLFIIQILLYTNW